MSLMPTLKVPMGLIEPLGGNPVYLDGFATTPMAPEVRDAMLFHASHPGNAGSPHLNGVRAGAALDGARSAVASLIGADASEIIFTSGATEANNLAILGVARWAVRAQSPRRKIVVSTIEHKAVLSTIPSLEADGFEVAYLPVTADGRIDLDAAREVIDPNTLLVSAMLANNETGAIQPIAAIARIARTVGALLHCDAAQAAGKIAVDAYDLDVDYMSLSAHKMYGPMGVGSLYIASGAPVPASIMFGGGQERAIRPGTEPVFLLAAFGVAADLALQQLDADGRHSRHLVECFRRALDKYEVDYFVTTNNAPTLPGALSISIVGVSADSIISALSSKISISTGSACSSGQILPSHVLIAMGMKMEEAESVIRIYFGRYNTVDHAILAATAIVEVSTRLREATGRSRQ